MLFNLKQLGENYDEISQNFFRLVDAKNLDAAKAEVTKPRVAKVKEMQSSVSTGVMEMDRFNQQVSSNVATVGKISGQIATVIEQVQSLTPRFEEVSHSMEQQFEGAQQISSALRLIVCMLFLFYFAYWIAVVYFNISDSFTFC